MAKAKKETTLKEMFPNEKRSKKFDAMLKETESFLKDQGHLKDGIFLSGLTLSDVDEGECIQWETFTERRPDPLHPGRFITVIVKRCIRRAGE